jgi:hypothetical protein
MVLTYFTHNINFENNRKPRSFEKRFPIGISLIFKSFTSGPCPVWPADTVGG